MALRVLAHFVPGPKVLDFLAPEADWLDIRWCADDDTPDSQAAFYRELPDAEVIWHVLRPLSAADLLRATRLRLVHKFGAGVNTIDVETARSIPGLGFRPVTALMFHLAGLGPDERTGALVPSDR